MTETALPRASYRDVLAAPPTVVAEVVRGQLHMAPRPDAAHARVASMLGGLLISRFGLGGAGGPGGWRIFVEAELHLGDEPDIVVPDLAGWHLARMSEVPETPYIAQAPDWVCEVLSPSTETLDRSEKMDVYLQAGVTHLWLIAPASQTLEVYLSQGLAQGLAQGLSQGLAQGLTEELAQEPAEGHAEAQGRRWVHMATHVARTAMQVEPFADVALHLEMLWPR